MPHFDGEMLPARSRRRRRSTDDEDEDEESSAHSGDSPKRPRVEADSDGDIFEDAPQASHTNGETANGDYVNGNGVNGNHVNGNHVNGNHVNGNDITAHDNDDFQPGAIVRVTVENFVTYEKAEFLPGPHLNMVIGPNGTGKSSLVCAICLGLGYSPKHLGRAGSVKEFVKHGKDVATIETELYKRPKDRKNFTVRVQIRRDQNTQKWWINNKETTHKTVQGLMRTLKIQVDNLCQFLPQDRVVEFAACTPVDLLHETLRAAAPEKMLRWQHELRELHKDKKNLSETARTDVETLRNLEARQLGLQGDMDRIREREEILEQVRDLKSALILSQYQEARTRHNNARQKKKDAERSLRRLEEECGPSLEAVNDKQQYAREIEIALSGRRHALKAAEDATKRLAREAAHAGDEFREFESKIAAERKGYNAKKKDVAFSKARITGLKADLKNKPIEFNPADYNQRIRAEEHKLRDMETEQREINARTDVIKAKGKTTSQALKKAENDLIALDTQEGQQLKFMERNFPEIYAGWEWVQENQNQFEKEVFGPPMVSCSIKDDRYTDQVQALLQADDFSCFTTQTRNDYKKLTEQFYRVMSLSVVVRTCQHSLDSFRRPLDENETSALGLDGWAIDYLQGPAPVLAMLCAEKKLHQSGVSLNDHDDAQYERLVQNGKVNQWAAGKQSFMIRRRREYGPQAMTTVTRNIQQGRFWTSQLVDSYEKVEMKKRIAEIRDERQELLDEYRAGQEKWKTIEDDMSDVKEKIEYLRNEKAGLQKEHQKWQGLPAKIESEERVRAQLEVAMFDAKRRIAELRFEWDAAGVHRAEAVLRHHAAIERLRKAHHAVLEASICRIEALSDVASLMERNAHIMKRVEEEKANLVVATEEANLARDAGHEFQELVQDLLAREPEKRERFSELCAGKNPQDMEEEVQAEEAKLDLIQAANPSVVRDYERRAAEIVRIKEKLEGAQEKVDKLDTSIDALMAKFEPELDELADKINDAFAYNFEQIHCAGEVRVNKDPDFENWSMEVLVRFRESEHLQQLTAHRQSGGERAVSTIFYLMALQSMAQSPFRVVDEINQGMDPRNERMVHERMVEIACREHTSQYFLITPKLLTGLRYDAKMRVLCIASGEHMPGEGKRLDFRRCVGIQKALMAAA